LLGRTDERAVSFYGFFDFDRRACGDRRGKTDAVSIWHVFPAAVHDQNGFVKRLAFVLSDVLHGILDRDPIETPAKQSVDKHAVVRVAHGAAPGEIAQIR
jgi:hypothetical protein